MKERKEFQEEYHFVKEVIKKKPMCVRGFFLRFMILLAGVVGLGLAAALVFVRFWPFFENTVQDTNRIVFEEDDPNMPVADEKKEDIGSEDTDLEESELDFSQGEALAPSDSMDSYQKLPKELSHIAEDVMKSMVTVSTIGEAEDAFLVDPERVWHVCGVIIAETRKEFYILAKYRMPDIPEQIRITFYDGSAADGSYLMHDEDTELVILTVLKEHLPKGKAANMEAAVLGNSYHVQRGESVIAIGSTLGYSNSVAHGQVTSTTSTASVFDAQYNLLVTNILGNDDGSGVLFNSTGEVIGVIAQEYAKEHKKEVITCLPISQLKAMLTALANKEEMSYLGIKGQTVTEAITKQTGMPKGIYISEMKSDSPALQAGIQMADILTQYNGKRVDSMEQYAKALSKASPGEAVTVTVMRKGTDGYVEFQFEVTLGSR